MEATTRCSGRTVRRSRFAPSSAERIARSRVRAALTEWARRREDARGRRVGEGRRQTVASGLMTTGRCKAQTTDPLEEARRRTGRGAAPRGWVNTRGDGSVAPANRLALRGVVGAGRAVGPPLAMARTMAHPSSPTETTALGSMLELRRPTAWRVGGRRRRPPEPRDLSVGTQLLADRRSTEQGLELMLRIVRGSARPVAEPVRVRFEDVRPGLRPERRGSLGEAEVAVSADRAA